MAINGYVVIDMMRPAKTLIDLTNNFNGRVGDSESYLKVWIKSNGLPKDLTNYDVALYGKDPNANPIEIRGTALADQPGDSLQVGRVTLYFPAPTFQVSGDWDDESTFIAVLDNHGNRVSTQNVHIHVLDDKVTMGIKSGPFLTDLETVKNEMIEWCDTTKAEIQAILDNANSGALASAMAALKTQVEAYQDLISKSAVVSQTDFDALKSSFQQQLDEHDSEIGNFKVLENRTTQLMPSEYITKYLGLKTTELVSAGTIGLGNNRGLSSTSYGFLETDVVPYAADSAVKGSVVQVYRTGATGVEQNFMRTSVDASNWSGWNADVIINRTTQLTPADYVDRYLGRHVIELVNQDTLAIPAVTGVGTGSWGYLETNVIPFAGNEDNRGSIIQTYKIAVPGYVDEFTRTNATATTWTGWQINDYKFGWTSAGIVYKNGATADATTPLQFATYDSLKRHELMITGGIIAPAMNKGASVDVCQLPAGAAQAGASVKLGKSIGGDEKFMASISAAGVISLVNNGDDRAPKGLYLDMLLVW